MSEYATIWKDMEVGRGVAGTGQLRRRIRADSNFDLFVAVEKPSNTRALLLDVAANAAATLTDETPALRNVALHLRANSPGRTTLELQLTNRAYEELFSILVRDLVERVVDSPTEGAAVLAFVSRLELWQRLLARSGPEGLSDEAQRGLYAELWFMREHLLPVLDGERTIQSWTGPHGTSQDFQLPDLAVEVKSTASKLPQRMLIASERQLDDTGVDILFLFHLSLDARRGNGETLSAIVDALRDTLGDQGLSRPLFEENLLVIGYLDAHRGRYDRVGYTVRGSNLFHVRDDFPRIVEPDLPGGVGDVRYSLAVSECSPFAVSEQLLLERLEGVTGVG